MTIGGYLAPLLVLILMSVFHGEWLALAEEKELTPEELAKGIQKWQEALNYYAAAAENGLKEGELCDDGLMNEVALYSMEIVIGKTAEELEREFKEGGVEVIPDSQERMNELGTALIALHPEAVPQGVCAAARNLNCGTSLVGDIEFADPKTVKCEPCTCEAPKKRLCDKVAKVVKDRNLPGVSVPKCGDNATTAGPAAATSDGGGSRERSTTAKMLEPKSERSTGQTSGVSYSAGGNSCGLLLIIGFVANLI